MCVPDRLLRFVSIALCRTNRAKEESPAAPFLLLVTTCSSVFVNSIIVSATNHECTGEMICK